MKITRRQLRKLIQESLLREGDVKKMKSTYVHNDDAEAIAKSLLDTDKKKPTFKLHLDKHTAYNAYIKPTGQISGKYHFELIDPKSGIKLDGGGHIEFPGLSDKEGTHLGGEIELAKHLKQSNVDVFLKGDASTHLGLDHGNVHISAPDTAITFGVKGKIGKSKKKHV
tara:strand:+ start:7403 stop:7906 length:504 start_codon:yes stop_codon:yes gene_type:complete